MIQMNTFVFVSGNTERIPDQLIFHGKETQTLHLYFLVHRLLPHNFPVLHALPSIGMHVLTFLDSNM